MTEPRAMQEVHEIREQMSREIAGMSVEEQTEYFRAGAARLLKEWGITPVDISPSSGYARNE